MHDSFGSYVEVQSRAEGEAISRSQLPDLLDLAARGIGELLVAQREALLIT